MLVGSLGPRQHRGVQFVDVRWCHVGSLAHCRSLIRFLKTTASSKDGDTDGHPVQVGHTGTALLRRDSFYAIFFF